VGKHWILVLFQLWDKS